MHWLVRGQSTMADEGALMCPWEGAEGELCMGGDGGGGEECGSMVLTVKEVGTAAIVRQHSLIDEELL
jgi:hypothetical protein